MVVAGEDRGKRKKTNRDPTGGLQDDSCAYCRYAEHAGFSPDAMTTSGCELQDKTRHITLAQGQLLGNLAQSPCPAAKASRRPYAATLCLPTDSVTQLGGAVQRAMTAACVSECVSWEERWRWPCAHTRELSADRFLLLVSKWSIIRAFGLRLLLIYIDCIPSSVIDRSTHQHQYSYRTCSYLHSDFLCPPQLTGSDSLIRLVRPATTHLQPPPTLRLERQHGRPELQRVALPHHHVSALLQS